MRLFAAGLNNCKPDKDGDSSLSVDVTTKWQYNNDVRFEWDERKRRANIRNHGIDFVDAESVFEGDTFVIKDDRYDYGEDRFIRLGLLRGQVVVIVSAERDEVIRIISMRKANRHEENTYFKKVSN